MQRNTMRYKVKFIQPAAIFLCGHSKVWVVIDSNAEPRSNQLCIAKSKYAAEHIAYGLNKGT